MKVVIQRVKKATVSIDNHKYSEINRGLVVLVGIKSDDTIKDIKFMIDKISNLRIFPDESGVMNHSVLDYNLELLVVPNFTIYASVKRGRRPSYTESAKPEVAKVIFDEFIKELEKSDVKFSRGVFQADMEVNIVNDGPITIIVES